MKAVCILTLLIIAAVSGRDALKCHSIGEAIYDLGIVAGCLFGVVCGALARLFA